MPNSLQAKFAFLCKIVFALQAVSNAESAALQQTQNHVLPLLCHQSCWGYSGSSVALWLTVEQTLSSSILSCLWLCPKGFSIATLFAERHAITQGQPDKATRSSIQRKSLESGLSSQQKQHLQPSAASLRLFALKPLVLVHPKRHPMDHSEALPDCTNTQGWRQHIATAFGKL
jgi:hypothetical protein